MSPIEIRRPSQERAVIATERLYRTATGEIVDVNYTGPKSLFCVPGRVVTGEDADALDAYYAEKIHGPDAATGARGPARSGQRRPKSEKSSPGTTSRRTGGKGREVDA